MIATSGITQDFCGNCINLWFWRKLTFSRKVLISHESSQAGHILGDLCVPRGENILGHSRRCWSSSFVRFLCGCWLLSRENFSRLQNLSDLLCDGDENDNIHLSCTLYSLFYPLIARFGICKQNSLTLFVHELVFCCAFGICFFTSSIDKLLTIFMPYLFHFML